MPRQLGPGGTQLHRYMGPPGPKMGGGGGGGGTRTPVTPARGWKKLLHPGAGVRGGAPAALQLSHFLSHKT